VIWYVSLKPLSSYKQKNAKNDGPEIMAWVGSFENDSFENMALTD
jgi:hypothetical protein